MTESLVLSDPAAATLALPVLMDGLCTMTHAGRLEARPAFRKPKELCA